MERKIQLHVDLWVHKELVDEGGLLESERLEIKGKSVARVSGVTKFKIQAALLISGKQGIIIVGQVKRVSSIFCSLYFRKSPKWASLSTKQGVVSTPIAVA